MKKTKISFFFGAGAEMDFNVHSGYEFMIKTMYSVPNSYKDIISKNTINSKYYLTKKSIISDYFAEKFVKDIKRLANKRNEEIEMLLEELKVLLKSSKYIVLLNSINDLNNNKLNKSKIYRKIKEIIDYEKEYLSYINRSLEWNKFSNILDSYFHNLIDFDNSNKFDYDKVVNYYWFCFLDILTCLREIDLIDNSKLYTLYDYVKYCKKISITDKLEKHFNFDASYYKLIKEHFKSYNINCVVTTNYTRLSSYILNGKNTYNIHGRLDYYEFPDEFRFCKNVRLKDLKENKVFPFILGQSSVKPIICFNQISNIVNAFKKIYNSDILVVLGYGINGDDDHINSMIRDFILKGKKIIFVSSDTKDKIEECLCLNETFYSKESLNLININDFKFNEEYDNEGIVNEIFKKVENMQ